MANDCLTCQYIWPTNNECRRFPPTIVITGASTRVLWPVVADDDWCGEYNPVETGAAITLTSLAPASLPAGSPPSTVDVYGTGFDNTCDVYSDGVARTTFFIDIGHLQYTARPDQANSGDTHQITVENSAGATSNALTFTFT